ncbi:hypothetical protein, partial [Thermogutta sp.]|uniref:hypothetical protein n=1 Tax=Thermogutta sp. TaxID=1962930 RepID=UPI0025DA20A4
MGPYQSSERVKVFICTLLGRQKEAGDLCRESQTLSENPLRLSTKELARDRPAHVVLRGFGYDAAQYSTRSGLIASMTK